jgi:hypothetical protein
MALCLLLRILRFGRFGRFAERYPMGQDEYFPLSWSPASGGDYAHIYTYNYTYIYAYIYTDIYTYI